jgi:hypothetical protein
MELARLRPTIAKLIEIAGSRTTAPGPRMEIYLAALLWILVSVPVAIVVGTVIRVGSSGLPSPLLPVPSPAASRDGDRRRSSLVYIRPIRLDLALGTRAILSSQRRSNFSPKRSEQERNHQLGPNGIYDSQPSTSLRKLTYGAPPCSSFPRKRGPR